MAVAVVNERELIPSITWFDGFVVALANPSFLITGLGGSVLSLGGWGAIILWLVSVSIGALHNQIYSELAAMFPQKSGGIALYAHEAWKRYCSFVGPLAAFGYWIGWSVVLSATGVVTGFLVQAQFYPSSAAASSSWNHVWSLGLFDVTLSFPIVFTIFLIAAIWVFNILGMRTAVWLGYVTGALLLIPLAVFVILPYLTGNFDAGGLHNNISASASAAGTSSVRLVIVWLYLMCWSSYGFECCATFAPEYKNPVVDTPKALRSAALFGVLIYGLLPLGTIGTIGDKAVTAGNFGGAFYVDAFKQILGGGAGIAVILLCAGIVLAMNTATADGSRALYGIAKDDMTIKQLGKLNSKHVPGVAMTADAILNMLLLVLFAGQSAVLQILAFSNMGYVLAHVFAISGFLLLRRDRPNMERPIKLAKYWLPIAAIVVVFDTMLLAIGSVSFKITGYGSGWKVFWVGLAVLALSLVLYVYRVVVQDKQKLRFRLRDEPPTMPSPLG